MNAKQIEACFARQTEAEIRKAIRALKRLVADGNKVARKHLDYAFAELSIRGIVYGE